MPVAKRLVLLIKPVWFRFAVALVGMMAVAAINAGTAWLLQYLLDHALADKDFQVLITGVQLVVLFFGLKSILWYTHTYLMSYVSQTVAHRLRNTVYSHLYSLSMGFFNHQTSSGILARLTNDITILQMSLVSGPTVVLRDGLTVVGLIGFLFYSNWRFALMSFLVVPIAGFFLTKLGRKSRRAGREGQARMAEIYNIIQEAITAMPIVKVFQAEQREIDEFASENRSYFNAMMKLVRVEARSSPIMEFLGALVLAMMLAVGGRQVINGTWSLGGFAAFIFAAMNLYKPIKTFASVNVQIQQGFAAAERVFELLDQRGTVTDTPNAPDAKPLHDRIRLENVSFSYPSSGEVLHEVNLDIKKGQVVAIVGASGSGKSTIAQLLLRFYDPTSGRVTLDGIDLRDLRLASLRSQAAVVTQETHLFNDTVLVNIAYGRPGASRGEIEDAARAAFAHDFILRLPNGYDTVIGERGTRLSGGERQRLAIARSILKNPAILVLDEATSSLDAASEQAVQQALDRLLEGRTVLMIAHRLSTVRRADRIVVLDRGRIVESGAHDELLAKGGRYRELHNLQTIG